MSDQPNNSDADSPQDKTNPSATPPTPEDPPPPSTTSLLIRLGILIALSGGLLLVIFQNKSSDNKTQSIEKDSNIDSTMNDNNESSPRANSTPSSSDTTTESLTLSTPTDDTTKAPTATPGSQSFEITDLTPGTGEEVFEGSSVVVHYKGTFEDGRVFDESRPRGEPFSFTLGEGRVIRGWELGLLGMKTGGKRKLVVPPELAYGEQGFPSVIPPSTTLVFEIELISTEAPGKSAP